MDGNMELYHLRLDSGETIAINHYAPASSFNGETVVFVHEDNNKDFVDEITVNLINQGMQVYSLNLSQHHPSSQDIENRTATIINACYEELVGRSPDYLNALTFISCDAMALRLAAWVHDYAPQIKSLILFCPTPALSEADRLYRTSPGKEIDDYTLKKFRTDSAAIYTPTLLVISKQPNAADSAFYKRLGSLKKKQVVINSNASGVSHLFTQEIINFHGTVRAEDRDYSFLLQADSTGYTWQENYKLMQPESHLLRRCYWQLNKAALLIAGQFSTGIKIGLRQGFDSGAMLDYIYENQPSGSSWLAQRIDRAYLNSVPWQGARARKKWVHEHITTAIELLADAGKKINLLDVAAGHGRYIFELSDSLMARIDHVLMRDYDSRNVEFVNQLIAEKSLGHKITYEKGDAFAPDALATLPRDRTLAVASGFYELFDDNAMVLNSMKGVYDALEPGGILVYTGIPWHPRHEYMARVMTRNRDGKLWVLRRRTQQELDYLIRQAGFTKIKQRMDPWGIYSISMARKGEAAASE
jgi:SAM-dependent methyltransferase